MILDGKDPRHAVWLHAVEVANERPPSEPGFRRSGERLTYTTERGVCYVVQDAQGRPCLVPSDDAPEGEIDDDDADPRRIILAEAADQLDAELGDGWFVFRYLLFFRSGSSTRLIYATDDGYRSLPVAEVPASAIRVDVVPPGALACVAPPPANRGDHG